MESLKDFQVGRAIEGSEVLGGKETHLLEAQHEFEIISC